MIYDNVIISIHSSHTGRDIPLFLHHTPYLHFNPLFPYGKRHSAPMYIILQRNFNPLFPYGKRHVRSAMLLQRRAISIHSSHTGRDLMILIISRLRRTFQSTLPIREETVLVIRIPQKDYISIHSSHTGRDIRGEGPAPDPVQFQSTLPIREETKTSKRRGRWEEFQSTLPIREETHIMHFMHFIRRISIHSSHTGRDKVMAYPYHAPFDFNPLFPYGKRRTN